jgi:hypothetical protein
LKCRERGSSRRLFAESLRNAVVPVEHWLSHRVLHPLQILMSNLVSVRSVAASTQKSPGSGNALSAAIYTLDARLRQREGVYEYTVNPDCMLRIQRTTAACNVTLPDGRELAAGDPITELHFWNEQFPKMPDGRPTVAWAKRARRAFQISLEELAVHISAKREFDDVQVLIGVWKTVSPGQERKLLELTVAEGFQHLEEGPLAPAGAFRRLGENILFLFLVLASNPAVARFSLLLSERTLIYISREELLRRHLPERGIPEPDRQ